MRNIPTQKKNRKKRVVYWEPKRTKKRRGKVVIPPRLLIFIIHLGSHHYSSAAFLYYTHLPSSFSMEKHTAVALSHSRGCCLELRGRSAWEDPLRTKLAQFPPSSFLSWAQVLLNHSSLRQGPRCSSIYPPSLSLSVCVCLSATFLHSTQLWYFHVQIDLCCAETIEINLRNSCRISTTPSRLFGSLHCVCVCSTSVCVCVWSRPWQKERKKI
jgi:hypothetical protein